MMMKLRPIGIVGFLILLVMALPLKVGAKSIVFRLNDAKHTLVYYKLSTPGPQMVLGKDATVTISNRVFQIKDIEYFYYTTEDYSGATGTEDGLATNVVEISEDRGVTMKGKVDVVTLDGKVLAAACDDTASVLNALPKGTYVVTDGVTKIKIQKK